MIEPKKQAMPLLLGLLSVSMLLVTSGCGKGEATGGLFGGAGGAAVGAAIAGPNNAGLGAVIGGLAGYAVGSGVGRAADDEEAAQENRAREHQHRREVNQLQQEKARIAQAQTKWCSECGKQDTDVRSRRCAECCGMLCHEKYCPECGERYKPTARNKYCTYCEKPVLLKAQ